MRKISQCRLFVRTSLMGLLASLVISVTNAQAAHLVLPNIRHSYYSHEKIELAIADLAADQSAQIVLKPKNGAMPYTCTVVGKGGTSLIELPSFTLSPGQYQIALDGQSVPGITLNIARANHSSGMLFSETGANITGNFVNYHASGRFGLIDRDGSASADVRQRSSNIQLADRYIQNSMPALCYVYWTGYVTHKPWGMHKEWVSDDMLENMRLFNFHVAQRLRRQRDLWISIGAIDEPGLPWGKTPAGGSASGFADWNTAPWLEQHGFEFTNDPGALGDSQYMQYMNLRKLMLREPHQQATDDIKSIWPEALFASDLYAPGAVGDGTDPMNQVVNDIPTTHVFADYGYGKIGVLGAMYMEKAHDPTSKLAHAMNGQLFGDRNMPHPRPLHAFQLMRNVLLASGLDSNWWLNHAALGINPQGKSDRQQHQQNLETVNEPAIRMGSILHNMAPDQHDVAVLWSYTEIAMRGKPIMQMEAGNANGEQIKLMIASMPENTQDRFEKNQINLYSVGGNYRSEIITAHSALSRAGYPAHIIHEDLLANGVLDNYKVLVIAGQTHAMSAESHSAISAFVASGGKVLVDQATTVAFDGASVVELPSVKNQGYHWTEKFVNYVQAKDIPADKKREYSYFGTNHFMESFSRDAAEAFRNALAQTDAQPVMVTDSHELASERHAGGDGQMIMIINGYEELPDLTDDKHYYLWNYAAYDATYSLPTIKNSDAVYLIEGSDWQQVSQINNPTALQTASFEPGEMKMYLVAPNAPKGLTTTAKLIDGRIDISASLEGLKMPWPLTVTVTDPTGEAIVTLYRATDTDGQFKETIALGKNASDGQYTVTVASPAGELHTSESFTHQSKSIEPSIIVQAVRVFDAVAIKDFLSSKPAITIATPSDAYQAAAEQLASQLRDRGIKVTIKPEQQTWAKASYPRVWDPYGKLYVAEDETKPLPEGVEKAQELVIQSDYFETPTITTLQGKTFTDSWQTAGNVLTVGEKGYIHLGSGESFYEPGCVIAFVPVDMKNPTGRQRLVTLNGKHTPTKTDDAFRAKWSRSWQKLRSYNGGHILTPQLPEAYASDDNLILMGSSDTGELVRALQASELLQQTVDASYPGPGKALIQMAWSPFAVEKNVIYLGATDQNGIKAAIDQLAKLLVD